MNWQQDSPALRVYAFLKTMTSPAEKEHFQYNNVIINLANPYPHNPIFQ